MPLLCLVLLALQAHLLSSRLLAAFWRPESVILKPAVEKIEIYFGFDLSSVKKYVVSRKMVAHWAFLAIACYSVLLETLDTS